MDARENTTTKVKWIYKLIQNYIKVQKEHKKTTTKVQQVQKNYKLLQKYTKVQKNIRKPLQKDKRLVEEPAGHGKPQKTL